MKLLHLRHANRVAFAASLLAILVLCVCLVYWATVLLAPRSPIAPVEVVADPRANVDARAAGSLFGVGGSQGAPVATVSDIQVIGLAASRTRAAAILVLDGKPPRAYGEGETLSRGIKLLQVADDGIVIERNGSRQRLDVPARASLAVLNSGGARPRSNELIAPVQVTPGSASPTPSSEASPRSLEPPAAPATPAPSSSQTTTPVAPAMMAPPSGTAAPALPAPGTPGYDAVPTTPAQASAPPGVALTPPPNPLNRMPDSAAGGQAPPDQPAQAQ